MVDSTETTVPVDGAVLHYSTEGKGPTCLVLSAIGSDPYQRMMPSQLAERLRLVYIDLRGSGRSTGDPADLTFEVLAGDLEAIRGELGVDRVAVLGHSILGALAIEYARRRPGSVSHVVLVGTPPSGDMASLATKSSAFFEEHASAERKRLLQENLANLPEGASMAERMHAQTPMRFYDARFDAVPLFAGGSADPGLLMHILGTLIPGWDVRAESGSLRGVPIFIAHGRHDYTVPYVLWDGVVDALPDATLRLFDHSGHQPFFEEPELFADALSKWLADG